MVGDSVTGAKISRVIHKETGLEGIYENGAMHILVEPTDVYDILEEPPSPGIYKLNVFAEGIIYARKVSENTWLVMGCGTTLTWKELGSIIQINWLEQ